MNSIQPIQTIAITTTLKRLLLTAAFCLPLFSGQVNADERKLDIASAKRIDIRRSQIGIRNTLLFYTFTDQKAVLQILIDNKDTTFPVSGTIHLFADATTKEDLDKWINNQHSCGLHPDVPEPILTQPLPAGQCSVTAHKALEKEKNPTTEDMFQDYEVTLTSKSYALEGKLLLKAFTEKSKVYVKL